ncbi:DUF262 domain-containing protein [Frateuria sp. GZRe12]|uniref:DUF262 domain-containing protein n=1 Tax=Frateuria sp. GZRe12 TaxID=3351533 RepID=UPI003EDBCB79
MSSELNPNNGAAVKATNAKIEISPIQKDLADAQIREKQSEVKYDLRDFTVEHIVTKFVADEFYVPEYQRAQVWTNDKRSRFVESIFLGLPIPMMFLADMEDGRFEVVDGVQRMGALEAFTSGDLELSKLERLQALNGFRFADVPLAQRRKFLARALRLVVLEESTTFETRQDIFNRVNTGGESARPSEVRRGAYQGAFMTFLEGCAEDPRFRRLCPITPSLVSRREPLELVLRFFALSERYKAFRHDVAGFLDEFLKDHREEFEEQRFRSEFDRMLDFVQKFFPYGFAKSAIAKTTPRVRFEAIAVGVNLALRARPELIPTSMDWLESDEFKEKTTTHASNSGPRMRGRIEFVRDSLLAAAA